MKTLYLSIIVAIGIAAVVSSFFFLVYPFTSNNQTVPSSAPPPQVSTVIIPKDSEDQSSGKNFEPRYLVVVLGVNNTVRWVNEAVVLNTVVADNKEFPLFWNATNYPFNGVLLEGKSFNFTFTKPGEFGYHTEPHPWLHGWVLVLPQCAENATQTVVLNDTKIPGPCEIFTLPCPNNPSFSAQKFGSDIYIEKITINGVDSYAIVNPSGVCVYPPSYRDSCTSPIDLAILRLVGVDTSIRQLEKIPVIINGVNSDFSFNYTITGGQIEQARADISNKALILSIKTTGDGTLIADLSRELIDPKANGQDSQFIILEDGQEVEYRQIKTTSTDRILNIPFPYGISKIEIIAPEPIR